MELLIGEPLALDLVNTRARDFDALDAPADFQTWLARQADRLTAPAAPLTADGLAAVRSLRGHVESALNAVREAVPPPDAAVAAINDAARAAPPYRRLEWRDGVFRAAVRRDGDDLAGLLAQLAEAAADLLTDPGVGRVRACEGPQCRMLFLPAHPRRRWCSPDLCGNRVRVARYYKRHKSA
ncbi:CGNR zinc finger domain-containing protein [Nonomuraea sp. SYSU D8015]|uniref:CGNR zinc finger domain-containing protein n=1 Tax=Nonomuraea sp. SYSU D8015 TaxID=2593644 RepID=UPI001661868B|nr:CGNR zinc finger domain-containing protein [Nonomuraea sp. SYSU D8015]